MLVICLLLLVPAALGAKCGNGYLESPEQCDDANLVNGDGCSSLCTVEKDFKCSLANPNLPFLSVCSETSMTVWSGRLDCDDGNSVDTDGCSNTGLIRAGFICLQSNLTRSLPDLCKESCGDGLDIWLVNENSRCDDGNNVDGDGCSHDCFIEPGFFKSANGV